VLTKSWREAETMQDERRPEGDGLQNQGSLLSFVADKHTLTN